jgi:hypothetical protein
LPLPPSFKQQRNWAENPTGLEQDVRKTKALKAVTAKGLFVSTEILADTIPRRKRLVESIANPFVFSRFHRSIDLRLREVYPNFYFRLHNSGK